NLWKSRSLRQETRACAKPKAPGGVTTGGLKSQKRETANSVSRANRAGPVEPPDEAGRDGVRKFLAMLANAGGPTGSGDQDRNILRRELGEAILRLPEQAAERRP